LLFGKGIADCCSDLSLLRHCSLGTQESAVVISSRSSLFAERRLVVSLF
jgi:hypothetical protein